MKFLMVFAFVALAATNIWAKETTDITSEAVKATTTPPSGSEEGACTYACAIKKLFFDEDDFGRTVLKILVKDSNGEEVDEVFEACKQASSESAESCEEFFSCAETEFRNKNVTFII